MEFGGHNLSVATSFEVEEIRNSEGAALKREKKARSSSRFAGCWRCR
jgi:hypothetical protein